MPERLIPEEFNQRVESSEINVEQQENNKLLEQTLTRNLNSPHFLERLKKIPTHSRTTAIGNALQYHCLHPDGFDFEEFTKHMEDKFVKNFDDLSDEVINSVRKKLALEKPTTQEQHDNQDQQVYEFIAQNFVQNGYVFHGFNGAFETQIRQQGLTTSERKWDVAEIKRTDAIIKKTGNHFFPFMVADERLGMGDAWGTSREKVYYASSANGIYRYALTSPEWFGIITQDNANIPRDTKSQTAFFRRDYETARRNFESFCSSELSKGSIQPDEKEELLNFFEKYWAIFAGPDSKPKVALIARSAVDATRIPKSNDPNLTFKKKIRFLIGAKTGEINGWVKKPINPKEIVISSLPNYSEVFGPEEINVF